MHGKHRAAPLRPAASATTSRAHGGVPYLCELDPANDRAAHIVWAERPRGPHGETPGPTGFAVLRLAADGTVAESFLDESGAVQYAANT